MSSSSRPRQTPPVSGEAASAEAAPGSEAAAADGAAAPETPAEPELIEVWRPGGRSEERRPPRHDRNRHRRGQHAGAQDGAQPAAAGEGGEAAPREQSSPRPPPSGFPKTPRGRAGRRRGRAVRRGRTGTVKIRAVRRASASKARAGTSGGINSRATGTRAIATRVGATRAAAILAGATRAAGTSATAGRRTASGPPAQPRASAIGPLIRIRRLQNWRR